MIKLLPFFLILSLLLIKPAIAQEGWGWDSGELGQSITIPSPVFGTANLFAPFFIPNQENWFLKSFTISSNQQGCPMMTIWESPNPMNPTNFWIGATEILNTYHDAAVCDSLPAPVFSDNTWTWTFNPNGVYHRGAGLPILRNGFFYTIVINNNYGERNFLSWEQSVPKAGATGIMGNVWSTIVSTGFNPFWNRGVIASDSQGTIITPPPVVPIPPAPVCDAANPFLWALCEVFVPDTATLQQFVGLWGDISNRVPFGYLSLAGNAITEALEGVPKYHLPNIAVFGTLKSVVGWLLWILFAVWLVKRIANMAI